MLIQEKNAQNIQYGYKKREFYADINLVEVDLTPAIKFTGK
jgi:hypothetical protein